MLAALRRAGKTLETAVCACAVAGDRYNVNILSAEALVDVGKPRKE